MACKLAAVTMARDECDIIELFVKINSRVFDAIYIVDHMSRDGTAEIIASLIANGYPVKYSRLNSRQFNQGEVITNLVRQVANLDLYDYIVPLDADEFLVLPSQKAVEDEISKYTSQNEYALIPWRTYCPISDDYYTVDAPLYELFRMRDQEPEQYFKVLIGNEYAKGCEVSFGSHGAVNHKFVFEPKILPLYLAHVPLRSCSQMLNKAILGSHALRTVPNRQPGMCFHWDLMANYIRAKDFKIHYEDLELISLRYSIPENSPAKTPMLMVGGPRLGLSSDTIEMKDLAKINSLQSFDYFMQTMLIK